MNLYEILNKLEITYDEIEHEAVYTIEEAQKLEEQIDGIGSKNLFLKDKNSNYYIYVLNKKIQ